MIEVNSVLNDGNRRMDRTKRFKRKAEKHSIPVEGKLLTCVREK
jgi:hypothetical protein